MNEDTLKGQWAQLKGHVREKWGKLTDDDVEKIQGRTQQLIGKLEERYGLAREEAQRQVDGWVREDRAEVARSRQSPPAFVSGKPGGAARAGLLVQPPKGGTMSRTFIVAISSAALTLSLSGRVSLAQSGASPPSSQAPATQPGSSGASTPAAPSVNPTPQNPVNIPTTMPCVPVAAAPQPVIGDQAALTPGSTTGATGTSGSGTSTSTGTGGVSGASTPAARG